MPSSIGLFMPTRRGGERMRATPSLSAPPPSAHGPARHIYDNEPPIAVAEKGLWIMNTNCSFPPSPSLVIARAGSRTLSRKWSAHYYTVIHATLDCSNAKVQIRVKTKAKADMTASMRKRRRERGRGRGGSGIICLCVQRKRRDARHLGSIGPMREGK